MNEAAASIGVEIRLLPIQPDNEPEPPQEKDTSLPELHYVVPSRTIISPQEFQSFR